jgi:hypothetical protein
MSDIKAQVIRAPSRKPIEATPAIFLAGSVTTPDWRAALIASLSHSPITILDPLRPDWDSSWAEDESFSPFREQVQWELDMQERADLVIIYFGPLTEAPISLLELGLCARSGKALVVCDPAYRKKGNVDITCRRFGVEIVDGLDGLAAAVLQRLGRGKGQDLLLRA